MVLGEDVVVPRDSLIQGHKLKEQKQDRLCSDHTGTNPGAGINSAKILTGVLR